MINLGVFFGGRSSEHDVSIITGTQLIENVDRQKYRVIPVYISREGEWFTGEKLAGAAFYRKPDFDAKGVEKVFFSPITGSRELLKKTAFGLKSLCVLDAAVIAMHGLHGEDGTLQGLFELADLPYTSAGVTGSAVGIDKIVMKAAFKGLGIPVLDCVYFDRAEYRERKDDIVKRAEEKFSYPLIVKPANLGSSIGITKAHNREELEYGIEVAVTYDRRVLVEPAIDQLKEINCAVLGEGYAAVTGALEQPLTSKEILGFKEKYLEGGGASKGMKSLGRILPAVLPKEREEEIKKYALEIFKGLDLKGVVRIDFMIDEAAGKLYANEVNTIPGSMAFYLFEPVGIPYKAMIDRLVEGALKRHKEKAGSTYVFESSILEKASTGGKAGSKGSKG